MTKLEEYELLAAMSEKHWPNAEEEAKKRRTRKPPGSVKDTVSLTKTKLQTRDVVADRINAELEELGETKRVSGKMVERARRTARLPAETKQKIRDGEITLTTATHPTPKQDRVEKKERPVPKKEQPRRPRLDDETARLRAIQAATDYQAMCNAPAGTLNIPLIRRVERIVEVIGELVALQPEEAVTQLPAERYHQFAFMHFAEWLLKFTHLCEEKRREVTPDLEPRIYRAPRDNPVLLGSEVAPVNDERLLGNSEQVTLHWLRKQAGPTTMKAIAVGLHITDTAVQQRLRRLLLSGYVVEAGLVRGEGMKRPSMTYQASPSVFEEEAS